MHFQTRDQKEKTTDFTDKDFVSVLSVILTVVFFAAREDFSGVESQLLQESVNAS
jgi:hypothetical protein